MNPIGVNSWVWVSPPTDSAIAEIAPRVSGRYRILHPDNQTNARATAIWRPLAQTQDALAQDGLTFSRGAFS
jgi:hypothetical protein